MGSSVTDSEETPADRAARNADHHGQQFLMLGHDSGVYYYLPRGGGQVKALKVSQHVEAEFIGLCSDENWWREH